MRKDIDAEVTVLAPGVTMHRAVDGGPVRFPVTGLKRQTTHLHSAPKAGHMILPAESNSEYAAMFLLDFSASILRYMAQPHLLKFPVDGVKREYTPDFEVVAPFWLAEQLYKGTPFAKAALKMPPARSLFDPLVTIVLEIKKERRREKDSYREKLEVAKKIYEEHGYPFFVLEETPDLDHYDCSHLPCLWMDRSLSRAEDAKALAWDHLRKNNGISTYAAMMDVCGGGPTGREKTNYLHINGYIWIDLSQNPLHREASTIVAMPPLLRKDRMVEALAFAAKGASPC